MSVGKRMCRSANWLNDFIAANINEFATKEEVCFIYRKHFFRESADIVNPNAAVKLHIVRHDETSDTVGVTIQHALTNCVNITIGPHTPIGAIPTCFRVFLFPNTYKIKFRERCPEDQFIDKDESVKDIYVGLELANPPKHQDVIYTDLIRRVLMNANSADSRAGPTIRVFGEMLRFDIGGGRIPILTTKHVNLWNVYHELIWFLRGDTDTTYLDKAGINIWRGNTSAEFIKTRGLNLTKGQTGPIYGKQWRNVTDANGCKIDQIERAIHLIKTDPNSRRIIVNSWNVAELDLMVLPPCHYSFQFYVADGKLSCMVTMRGADIGLGLPYNMVSYALLTYMIAQICDLEPGELIISICDAHIYETHLTTLRSQLWRTIYCPPILEFSQRAKKYKTIDEFVSGSYEDLVLHDYINAGALKMPMAV